jgi:Tol biopolymer transport system component
LYDSDEEDYSGEVYVMSGDGSERRRVLSGFDVANSPYAYGESFVVASDGDVLAAVVRAESGHEIYQGTVRENDLVCLTATGRECFGPTLSADGEVVVFGQRWYESEKKPQLSVELFVMRWGSCEAKQVTADRVMKRAIAVVVGEMPRILMLRQEGGVSELWSIGLDGAEPQYIAGKEGGVWYPTYSPSTGNVVYFGSSGVKQDGGIFSVPIDGSESPTRLTNEAVFVHSLSLSTDGKEAVFIQSSGDADAQGRGEICILSIEDGVTSTVCRNY